MEYETPLKTPFDGREFIPEHMLRVMCITTGFQQSLRI